MTSKVPHNSGFLNGKTEITDNGLYRYRYVGDNTYNQELIISKEDFIRCYKQWILGEDNNG